MIRLGLLFICFLSACGTPAEQQDDAAQPQIIQQDDAVGRSARAKANSIANIETLNRLGFDVRGIDPAALGGEYLTKALQRADTAHSELDQARAELKAFDEAVIASDGNFDTQQPMKLRARVASAKKAYDQAIKGDPGNGILGVEDALKAARWATEME